MKKLLLLAMLIPAINFAQETKTEETKTETEIAKEPSAKFTLSANYTYSDPSQTGFSLEYKSKRMDNNRNTSKILNVSNAWMDYESPLADVKGHGFAIELGSRTYLQKDKWDGLYIENTVSYGNIKFDENVAVFGKFEGTYSYWSIFNPNVGYKITVAKNVSLDPYVGANWKWEVKGKGDIDNKNVDNFVFRAGVKLGFTF